MHTTFKLSAPARISLFLHVTGRHETGLPLVQEVVTFVNTGDEISFSKYDSLLIDVDGPFAHELGSPRDNVVYKTALAMAQEYGVTPTGQLILTKNLPISSGIGGASSDIAAAMRGLVKLWGLPEQGYRQEKLGRALDTDVPSFLMRQPAWIEGIGDKMTWLPEMPEAHFVLAAPMMAMPTHEVFALFRRKFTPQIQYQGRRKTPREWIADLKIYRNDLTEAAVEICPEIETVLAALAATSGCHFARLSGSGPTCFGVYDTSLSAGVAAAKLRGIHPGWWVVSTSLLKRE